MMKLTVAFRNFTNAPTNDASAKKKKVGQQEIFKQYVKNIKANLRDNVLYVHAGLECVAKGPTDGTTEPGNSLRDFIAGIFFTN
jgi:hypothetical protein